MSVQAAILFHWIKTSQMKTNYKLYNHGILNSCALISSWPRLFLDVLTIVTRRDQPALLNLLSQPIFLFPIGQFQKISIPTTGTSFRTAKGKGEGRGGGGGKEGLFEVEFRRIRFGGYLRLAFQRNGGGGGFKAGIPSMLGQTNVLRVLEAHCTGSELVQFWPSGMHACNMQEITVCTCLSFIEFLIEKKISLRWLELDLCLLFWRCSLQHSLVLYDKSCEISECFHHCAHARRLF